VWVCVWRSQKENKTGVEGDCGLGELDSQDVMSTLGQLILNGDVTSVQKAIEKKPSLLEDTNVTTNLGATPLGWAVHPECKKEDVALWLIERGANVNARDNFGWTPLMSACRSGQPKIVESLVNNGASLNIQREEDGWTALMFACRLAQFEIVELLIKNGAKLNVRSIFGNTALMLACQPPEESQNSTNKGLLKCVKLCYAGGASLHLKNNRGKDALTLAVECGRGDASAFLKFVMSSEVANLLFKELKVPRSVGVAFFDHAVFTMEDCKSLEDADLQAMGVEKVMHRKKFLKHFQSSKQDSLPTQVAKRLSGAFSKRSPDDVEPKLDCFLTHNWGQDSKGRDNHERVARMNNALKGAGKKTWFDEERLTGNVVQQITTGIQNTEKVVVFVTRMYMKKLEVEDRPEFCRDEFLLAFRTLNPQDVIPVVMEPEMLDTTTWTGPLAFSAGQLLYIDFSEDSKFDEAFAKLFSRLIE